MNLTSISTKIDKYDKKVEYNKETGVLHGAGIESAVNEAINRYIENPDESVSKKLPKILESAKYRMNIKDFEIFIKEMEEMGEIPAEISGEEEFKLLEQAKEFDMLTNEQKERYYSLKDLYDIE